MLFGRAKAAPKKYKVFIKEIPLCTQERLSVDSSAGRTRTDIQRGRGDGVTQTPRRGRCSGPRLQRRRRGGEGTEEEGRLRGNKMMDIVAGLVWFLTGP